MESMSSEVREYLPQLPLLLTHLVGIALVIVFWKRCPQASLLVLISLSILLVMVLAHRHIWEALMEAFSSGSGFLVAALVTNLIYAGCTAMLIVGALGWRGQPPAAMPMAQYPPGAYPPPPPPPAQQYNQQGPPAY